MSIEQSHSVVHPAAPLNAKAMCERFPAPYRGAESYRLFLRPVLGVRSASGSSSAWRTLFIILAGIVATIDLAPRANAEVDFGQPVEVEGVNAPHPAWDFAPVVHDDARSLMFCSDRRGSNEIYVSHRETINDTWGPPERLPGAVNSRGACHPSLSSDGLSLYFNSRRTGGFGKGDLYVARRTAIDAAWGDPVLIEERINSSKHEHQPDISADGLELYFARGEGSDDWESMDIWVSRRESVNEAWGDPVALDIVNSEWYDSGPDISADGLMLFFETTRNADSELWMTSRPSQTGPWGEPVPLSELINEFGGVGNPHLATDSSMFYFARSLDGTGGGLDVWQAPVTVTRNLKPGDADQDWDFDQLDIVQVLQAGKYLSGTPATWGEGDWNGAPGGVPGNPPLGDGLFDQFDVVAALNAGVYATGPYAIEDGEIAVTSVPEPSSMMLLVASGLSLVLVHGWLRPGRLRKGPLH